MLRLLASGGLRRQKRIMDACARRCGSGASEGACGAAPCAIMNADMQKIDFHYNVANRLAYACRVARTVYKRGLTLAVWTSDERRLRELDSLLWRFDDLAFLPHVRAESPLAAETPIRLSSNLAALQGDVLLLLDDFLPPDWKTDFERFERIIDVVSTEPAELEQSRSRYRAYKAAGVTLAAYDRRR